MMTSGVFHSKKDDIKASMSAKCTSGSGKLAHPTILSWVVLPETWFPVSSIPESGLDSIYCPALLSFNVSSLFGVFNSISNSWVLSCMFSNIKAHIIILWNFYIDLSSVFLSNLFLLYLTYSLALSNFEVCITSYLFAEILLLIPWCMSLALVSIFNLETSEISFPFLKVFVSKDFGLVYLLCPLCLVVFFHHAILSLASVYTVFPLSQESLFFFKFNQLTFPLLSPFFLFILLSFLLW